MRGGELRVLHVLGELRPSGAEAMLLAAAPVFAEHGVRGEILSTGAAPGPFAPLLAQAGYRIRHIPFAKSPGFFVAVRRLMREDWDVVHLHTERANFWLGLTARLGLRHRVLRTIHNGFAFAGGLRLRRGLQRRLLQRMAVCHVAISESVRDIERRHFGLSTEVVPNWYDSRRFRQVAPAQRERARAALALEEDMVLVAIGNCSPVKNHTALIEAIALLPASARPVLLHVGTEEHDHPERALARRLGLAERVRFLGPLPDVGAALHAADLFVMPSLYEGFGVAAVEALATGLPAILADCPGLRDFRERFPGLQYCAPDAASLHAALRRMLDLDPAQRAGLAEDYPEIAEREYGLERGVLRYIRMYRGDAEEASPSAPDMAEAGRPGVG